MRITDRTFGLEIEIANVAKQRVFLPSGYEWSKGETVVNTDATVSRHYGGVVNTPPLRLRQRTREELRVLLDRLTHAGGKISWATGLHVHIYAGDLELEQLKRVYYLLYHNYAYIVRYCHITEWDRLTEYVMPPPTEKHYIGVKGAKDQKALSKVFENESNHHYVRNNFNIASYFTRSTVEFRCFRGTVDMHLLENSVLASYRFFQYALGHSEEEMMFGTYEDFVRTLKLPADLPPILTPLIFQGDVYDREDAYKGRYLQCSSRMLKCIEDTGETAIALVNLSSLKIALALWRKMEVRIYTRVAWICLIYRLARGEERLVYRDDLSWVEPLNGNSPTRQLAVVFFVTGLRKYIGRKDEYAQVLLESYKSKAAETIAANEEKMREIVEMFEHVPLSYTDIDDAVTKAKAVWYLYNTETTAKSSFRLIKRYTDCMAEESTETTDYDGFVERIPKEVTFYYFSRSPFLWNLHKLAWIKQGQGEEEKMGITFYSNKTARERISMHAPAAEEEVEIIVPPDTLDICDASKLRICKVPAKELYSLQKRFVKKVTNVSLSSFAFVVMYEQYCIGGFGFILSRSKKKYDLFQLTDFCTNNNLPRASKLILMCIKSKETQRFISRCLRRKIETVRSIAYTQNSVSMKYRGEYKLLKELSTEGKLVYEGELGVYATKEEIIERYKKIRDDEGKVEVRRSRCRARRSRGAERQPDDRGDV